MRLFLPAYGMCFKLTPPRPSLQPAILHEEGRGPPLYMGALFCCQDRPPARAAYGTCVTSGSVPRLFTDCYGEGEATAARLRVGSLLIYTDFVSH